jgi:hypothetical protein
LKDKSAPQEKIKAAKEMSAALDVYEENAARINSKALNIARSNDVISASEAASISKMPLGKQENEIRKLAGMAFNEGKTEAAEGITSIINTPKTLGDAERMAGEAYHNLPVLFVDSSREMVRDTAGRIIEYERYGKSLESLDKNSDRLKAAEPDLVKAWEATREQVRNTLEDKRMSIDDKTKNVEKIESKGAEEIGKILSAATKGEIDRNGAMDIGSMIATSTYKDEIKLDVIHRFMGDRIEGMKEGIKSDREDLEKAVGNSTADGIIKSIRTESADELNEQLKRVNGYSDTMAAATASAKYYDAARSNELLEKLREPTSALTPAEQPNLSLLTEASKGIQAGIRNAREAGKEKLSGNEIMRKAFENAERDEADSRTKAEEKPAAGYSKGLKEKIEGFESAIGESKS